ncbi:hypothetical protein [Nocardia brasiliensis]|uniref:hypothetical protein n=1 Tax=Nocardia brasiliensis TaxID=37326 RepID=UPI002455F224|nr:hypothetical protein [Nocardia brasiliensis]
MTNSLTKTADCAQCARLDAVLDATLAERDRLTELLEEMTDAISAAMGREFGEHTSANDPWRNAIRALKGLEA